MTFLNQVGVLHTKKIPKMRFRPGRWSCILDNVRENLFSKVKNIQLFSNGIPYTHVTSTEKTRTVNAF